MKKKSFKILAGFAFLIISLALHAAPMTNDDVINMAKAGIEESVIITTIKNSQSGFDISPNGLIALSKANVSKPIINAIVTRASASSPSTAPAAAASADTNVGDPDNILLCDNGATTSMTYAQPTTRKASRGMGFGGVAQYSDLQGGRATTRTSSMPYFIVPVPANASPNTYVVLGLLEPRKNGMREIMTALILPKADSVSPGIPPSRMIGLSYEKLADQSKAPAKYTLYKVTPAKPLKQGEYALLIWTGKGFKDAFYDFGVGS